MTTFAHTESGRALDPQPNTIAADYRKRYSVDVSANWQVEQVPDGTLHGASPDGQGGWTNPAAPAAPPKQLAELGGVAFHEYCATVLAVVNKTTPPEGMERLGVILSGMRACDKGLVVIAFERYRAAGSPGGKFTFKDIPTLISAIVSAGLATTEEGAALADSKNWPKG